MPLDEHTLEIRYAKAAKPDPVIKPDYGTAWSRNLDIATLLSIQSSSRERRHKLKPGNCWAYFSTCAVIKPLARGCCLSCTNGKRTTR